MTEDETGRRAGSLARYRDEEGRSRTARAFRGARVKLALARNLRCLARLAGPP